MKALTFSEKLAQRARLQALAREGVLFGAVFVGIGAASAVLAYGWWPGMYVVASVCALLAGICVWWVRAVIRKLEELR